MKRVFRSIQFASNIAIILLAVLAGYILIRQYIFETSSTETASNPNPTASSKQASARPRRESSVGKPVPLSGIDWKDNGRTLVLYLSTSCRFCNDSIPFYKKILNETPNTGIKYMAVFLQNEATGTKYLDSYNVKVDKVVSGALDGIGVSGTPTLLLVDENGMVTDAWIGRLDKEKENDVIAKLLN
ncbi:MAG: hypothetical protein KF855_14435 [Acidobacteria bacterium]|nr:hypothetical protein [Acidobacteriota bacterium]